MCAEAEISDEEEEEEGEDAVSGHRNKHSTNYECLDSSLSPAARLRLYGNQVWRMEVHGSYS